ncbi:phage tail protein [Endozoicomonas lisbonensis]|uniref:phage tail protein n=1 Tax=Endozoicomonas lisbonensis TaxID=3120522 RepID=UPI0033949954
MARNIDTQVRAVNRRLKKTATIEQRGASRALNTIAGRVRTRVVKTVSSEANIRQKNVRKRVYVNKSKPQNLRVRIVAYHRDIPVVSLGAKTTRRRGGVKAEGRHYPDAFIADGSKGYGRYVRGEGYRPTWLITEQVMQRESSGRYPLEVLRVSIKEPVERHTPKVSREQMREFPRIAKSATDHLMKRL